MLGFASEKGQFVGQVGVQLTFTHDATHSGYQAGVLLEAELQVLPGYLRQTLTQGGLIGFVQGMGADDFYCGSGNQHGRGFA
jgi:hypothetical protein